MGMEGTVGTEAVEDVDRPTGRTSTRMRRTMPTNTVTATREVGMLNTKVVTWSLALFGAVTYLVCITYGLIVPETLHMTGFLEQILPGFRWLTPVGFLIGLGESFLYGAYTGLVFAPIYNRLWRRWGGGPEVSG